MSNRVRVRVWDVGVRFFHWTLVVVYFVAYASGDDGVFHAVMGYTVLALIVFRVLWGVVGTRHARFSDFVYGPAATRRYVASLLALKPQHYVGHNPLGGWMVIALLVALLGACWSGLEAYGALGHGPLAADNARASVVNSALADDDAGERRTGGERRQREDGFWEDVHEGLSIFTLLLVFVHVVGVLFASLVHRENLIRAMVTGYKTQPGEPGQSQ